MAKKADWTRKLTKPIDAGEKRKLRTLADVRAFLLTLSEERQAIANWQSVMRLVMDAAQSGEAIDLTVPFGLARRMRQ